VDRGETVSAFEATVYGRPQPAGSKRAFVNRRTGRAHVVDAAKGSAPWKQEVAGAALKACDGEPLLLDGPLILDIRFYLTRPKGHYRTGKNAHLLRDSAPDYPTTKPDTTKLLRAVEDALTTVVWKDDAQVVYQLASKHYGTPERCVIRVDHAPRPITAGGVHEQPAALGLEAVS
jgi:Holliday junction resolvase RusA-like endonuclease